MYKYFVYILLFFVVFLVLVAGYIKLTFRFWSLQPVFHFYDFHCYFSRQCIINDELPQKNKFCNFLNIETIKYENVSVLKMDQFTKFTRNHFLRNGENQFIPKKQNIMPYFEGHNSTCFFSFYYEPELLTDIKKNTIIKDKKVVGTITTRPLHVSIHTFNNLQFDTYYVDYLCVDKMYRKKGVASQLIQTHHYNQRHFNREIQVSLFKREGELTGIVPLCIYNTFAFDMSGWIKPPNFSATVLLLECSKSNLHYLLDFIEETKTSFDVFIVPELSSILELIKTKNIYIYMLIENNTVICVYFFKKSCTFIKKGRESLILFASINGLNKKDKSNDKNTFIHGYKVALFTILEKNPTFKFAVVEEISDNYIILDDLKKHTQIEIINPTAYFFYNYLFHTISSKKTFIIC